MKSNLEIKLRRMFVPVLTAAMLLFLLVGSAISKEKEKAFDHGNATAVEVVERLHSLLIEAMKMGNNSTCPERYEFLAPFIENAFDFPLISRIVLGRRHWKNMDGQTQEKFIDAFKKMTISTYAKRFDSYSGERFEIVGAKLDRRGHFLVKAFLIKSDGDKIDFQYICRKAEKGWKIVSISAKGVNDLSVKRADYNSFLKKHSIDELIGKLQEQADLCLSPKKEGKR